MTSKVLVVFGVLLVSLLLISSEVGARELAEDSQQEKTTRVLESSKKELCNAPNIDVNGDHSKEAVKTNVENANYDANGYGGYGCYSRYCRYGSCYCCYKIEASEMESEAKLHN